METRRLVIAMLVAMIAVVGWQFLMRYVAQRNNWTMPQERAATSQPIVADAGQPQQPQATAPTTGAATGSVSAATATTGAADLQVAAAPATVPSSQPTILSLGSGVLDEKGTGDYALAIQVTPTGAGIERVVLNQFRAAVKSNNAYEYQKPIDPEGALHDGTRVLATESVTIDGKTVSLETVPWQVLEQTSTAATLGVTINDAGGKPVARVSKRYEVFPRRDASGQEDKSHGYEARFSQAIENLSGAPIRVRSTLNGVTPPVREMEGTDDRQVIAGYVRPGTIEVGHWMMTDFAKTHVTRDLTTSEKDNLPLAWVGSSSVYFDAILRPVAAASAQGIGLAKAVAIGLNPDDKDALNHKVATTLETTEVTLAAGQTGELALVPFFGPKKREMLNTDYFRMPPLGYDGTLRTMSSSYCGFCVFQPVINVLVWMLQGFHFLFRDWGLAIIALVVIVRLCLHPITKRSTVSMHKMQKMGPEMDRLKKKYADNQEELNRAMMQLYKEQGATPILGCLPMFLQMPIWIALWQSLQQTFELRHAPFLHPFGIPLTWINDLSKPDAIYTFGSPIPLLFGWHLHSINLLPIFMGIVFFLQQKFTPKPATMTPEQAQQQKMMTWMSTLMFPLMLYTGPAGLNLYIATSTTWGILESKKIRDHIKEKEEAEKEGRVFVEPTRKMKKRGGGDNGTSGVRRVEPDAPKGGLGGWFARMQQMAEDVRKEQEKKARGK